MWCTTNGTPGGRVWLRYRSNILEHRWGVVAALQRQRDRQQTGRFVQLRSAPRPRRPAAGRVLAAYASSAVWRCRVDRSGQPHDVAGGDSRAGASASVISWILVDEHFPRSSAAAAFGRDPARSGAASRLSSRRPTSSPPTPFHSGTLHDTRYNSWNARNSEQGALPSRTTPSRYCSKLEHAGDATRDRGDPVRPGPA